MKSTYTAIIKQDSGWWIGWIQEVPGVNAQEKTKPALLASLRVILKEALELNRDPDAFSTVTCCHPLRCG